MSLSIRGGGLRGPAALVRGGLGWPARAGNPGAEAEEWLLCFGHWHQAAVAALLLALLCGSALAPAPTGGAALLVGGALIGIPHGSSDFVVAHALLSRRLGVAWLPAFLAVYLAAVGITLAGWVIAPTATFALFLAVSGFHFGAADGEVAQGDDVLRYLARALTPVLPIFLCHPGEVAGLIGLMSGRSAEAVAGVLVSARSFGLPAYATLLGSVTLAAVARHDDQMPGRLREAAELALLAVAAAALPPLATFGIYFCLIHAVRHMAHLGHEMFPRRPAAAMGLATAIVLPSALACGLTLAFFWDALAGVLTTEHLLARALQLTAALTVPHVALEWWAGRDTA